MTRRAIRINSFVVVPLIVGLALVAEPFVKVVLTDAWLPCVPYLQIYCVFYSLMPVQAANLQAIKAVGRSDLYLRLELIKKILSTVCLLLVMHFGVFAIATTAVATNCISALMNVIPNRKLLSYAYKEQVADYFNGIIPTGIMTVAVLLLRLCPISDLQLLLMQIVIGALVYVGCSYVLKLDTFMYLLGIVRRMIRKK